MKSDCEGKQMRKWIYRIIIFILCCIIGFCLYKIGGILYEYHKGTSAYNEIQKLAGVTHEIDKIEEKGMDRFDYVDFEALAKKNEDIRAWIYSRNTVINYPIVQGRNNEYYLYRMFNREWNGKGSLFIDANCEHPFEDFNTIIYGHRMKDGSMFHDLIKYRDKAYYEKHRIMYLLTPDKRYKVRIFGVLTIPADSDFYRLSFIDDADKEGYINDVKTGSETPMDVEVTSADRIIMMSTCTYEFEDARLVVFGKLEEIKNE